MLEEISSKWEIIRNFTPAWFASVMGTGILAMTSFFYSPYIHALKYAAFILSYLNIALFFILLIPWTLRWIYFRKEALASLEHPVVSNFYITMPISIVVLAANFMLISRNKMVSESFWFVGSILVIFFSILTPFIMLRGEHVRLGHINPAWFIPPVALIVIPLIGAPLVSRFSGLLGEIVILINYFGWGAGFFLYLALLAICMYRFILHHPLPDVLAPTIWINLGPIGAGVVALIDLVENSAFVTIKEPFFVFSFILWGFGVWWVLMAIVMTLHYIKNLRLPYAMTWWAFIFPLGAYVAATHSVAIVFKMTLIDYIGFSLYWLLVFLWAITSVKTLTHSYRGTLFKGLKK